MAIRGVNLKETEEYILESDPGHPDNISAEVAKRARGKNLSEKQKEELAAEIAGESNFKPTVFMVGNLTQGDRVELGDMTTAPTMRNGTFVMATRRISKAYAAVRKGLKGWDNLLDHTTGEPVPFATETASDDLGNFSVVASEQSLSYLSQEQVQELADAIMDKNGLKSSLEKKLEGASSQPADLLLETGDAPTAPTNKKP
jgi:hypothetical protein